MTRHALLTYADKYWGGWQAKALAGWSGRRPGPAGAGGVGGAGRAARRTAAAGRRTGWPAGRCRPGGRIRRAAEPAGELRRPGRLRRCRLEAGRARSRSPADRADVPLHRHPVAQPPRPAAPLPASVRDTPRRVPRSSSSMTAPGTASSRGRPSEFPASTSSATPRPRVLRSPPTRDRGGDRRRHRAAERRHEVTPGWADAALAGSPTRRSAAVAPLVLQGPAAAAVPLIDSAGDEYDPAASPASAATANRCPTDFRQPCEVFGASASSRLLPGRRAACASAAFPETSAPTSRTWTWPGASAGPATGACTSRRRWSGTASGRRTASGGRWSGAASRGTRSGSSGGTCPAVWRALPGTWRSWRPRRSGGCGRGRSSRGRSAGCGRSRR